TALATGGLSVGQLFSGYPLAPNGGPALQGNLIQISDPSTVPLPMQNSTVAVVPILLTSAPTTNSGSTSTYTIVLLDTSTRLTYSLPVTMTPPPTGSGGG